ncbi:hypothetical protein HRbin33_01186 [bacterium HR33]|nr:hypothetical protein HRbin33_01186 [bacterium HR33]
MRVLARLYRRVRELAERFGAWRASRLADRDRGAAERWLRFAAWVAPGFSAVHRDLVAWCRRRDDRLAALEVARRAARRYSGSSDAWMLLGEAYLAAFRPDDALVAFEQALSLEERPDAAMAAGDLYARRGDYVNAGARYARAYAAGAGADALRANARALRAAGDDRAAEEAIALWKQVTGREWVEGE